MTKRVEFVIGRAKSGKSAYVFDKIIAHEKAQEPAVLIVPSRNTLGTEMLISERLDGGTFYTKIFSLSRLSDNVLKETNVKQVFISEQGRLMIIRKAIMSLELDIFNTCATKMGFAKTCDEVIQSFVNNLASPDEVLSIAERVEEPLLRRKLTDFANIYAKAAEILRERALDPLDNLNAFIDNIKNAPICRSHIYFDGFETTTENMYKAIEELILSSASFTATFRLDFSKNSNDSRLFAPDFEAFSRLKRFAQDNGYDVKIITPSRENRFSSPELQHLERNLFAFPYKQYAGDVDNIELVVATNIDAEVSAAAGSILSAVRDEGLRFQDIAVIASDEAAYAVKVRNEFEKNSIPVYCDVQYSLYSMELSTLAMSALRAINGSFDKHELISIMKTGLSGITREEAEAFENYLIAYGVYGSSLKEPLIKGDEGQRAALEPIRKKLIEPLIRLQSAMARGDVAAKARAIYQYLQDLQVHEQLCEKVEALQNEGNFAAAEKCSQAWNLLMGILEQANTVLGDVQISNSQFISIIEEGLRAQVVSSIPANVDTVLFGSMKRTMPQNIKRLYVLGVYEGSFPKVIKDEGIIDDAEALSLQQLGLDVFSTTASLTDADRLEIYTLLTMPSHKLYMSYPALVSNKPKLPSMLFEKIKQLFPSIKVKSSAEEMLKGCRLYNMESLAKELRLFVDSGNISDRAKHLYAYYSRFRDKAEQLEIIKKMLYFKASPDDLDAEFVKSLYGDKLYSNATRLESFNRCPFYHFVRYGLNVEKRKEYKVERNDEGSFIHDILDKFVRHLIDEKIDYKQLDELACNNLIEEVANNIAESFKDGYFMESERRKAKCVLLKKTAKRAAWAIIEHMQKGDFDFYKSEVKFGDNGEVDSLKIDLDDGRALVISGKVDRVDCYKKGNDRFIRVIDYKSSETKFNYQEIYEGLRLQLPLYSLAIAKGLEAVTSGMYYMATSASVKENERDIETALKKAFRLLGMTLNDESIVQANDNTLENSPSESFVIEAKRKKDGDYYPYAKLYDIEQIQGVQRYALYKARETAKQIVSGKITVSPCKNGKISCESINCPYKSICMLDKRLPDYNIRKVKPLKSDEFFAKLNALEGDDSDGC
jgi:ATP-dependent helicase/nuclease subunit B